MRIHFGHKQKTVLWIVGIAVLICVDQMVKFAVEHSIALNRTYPLLEKHVFLTHVAHFASPISEDRSAAFIPLCFLLALSSAFYYFRRSVAGVWEYLGLGLLLAGGISNTFDEIRKAWVVNVFSFCSDLYHCKTLNVADLWIATGAFLLTISLFREPRRLSKCSP